MAGVDVSSLVGQQNINLSNAQAQMANDFSTINDLSAGIVKATQVEGSDEAVIATQQAKGLLDAQQAARSVAASYGGNPDDVSFIMNKLGQQWMQTEDQRLQAEKVVQQKQSVSFLDDPLQWFTNKLTVNTDIDNYNNLAIQSDQLYTHLENINTLNTKTAESMKAIAQTQTAATVQATADAALQKTTIAANDARLKGILYNVQGIKDVTQMGQEQVDNSVKAAQTAIAAGHLAVAQAQLGVMQRELNMKADLYAEEVKQKVASDQADQFVADSVNKGRAAMGLPAVPSAKVFAMFKLGGEAGEALKQQYTIGSMTDAVGKPLIAPSSGTAARYLATSSSPLATTNPAVKPIIDLLNTAYVGARGDQQVMAAVKNSKDISVLDNAVSENVKQTVGGMAGNIKPGDNSNIFQAPPLTALATTQGFRQNPLYTTVLEPQVKAGMAETDPNKLISLTSAAIQTGQISMQDAASGLASLFSHAAALNTASKDYTRFGIAPQTSYNTTIDMTGIFGGATKINMMDKAQVTTALMKYLANSSRLESLQMGGGQ